MIGVGDLVECVKPGLYCFDITHPDQAHIVPKVGDILTVYSVEEWYGIVYLKFDEMPKVNVYDIAYFRKLIFPPSLETEISELLESELVSCK